MIKSLSTMSMSGRISMLAFVAFAPEQNTESVSVAPKASYLMKSSRHMTRAFLTNRGWSSVHVLALRLTLTTSSAGSSVPGSRFIGNWSGFKHRCSNICPFFSRPGLLVYCVLYCTAPYSPVGRRFVYSLPRLASWQAESPRNLFISHPIVTFFKSKP